MIHAIYAHFVMTPHAAVRVKQRGLKRLAMELAVALHDRVVAVGPRLSGLVGRPPEVRSTQGHRPAGLSSSA
jgi:hypothetical protein